MRKLLALLLALPLLARAANPSFDSFNTNQFGTTGNRVFFKPTGNGAEVTNFNVLDGVLWVKSPAELRVSGTGTEGEGRFLVSDLNGVLNFRPTWVLTSVTNGSLTGNLLANGATLTNSVTLPFGTASTLLSLNGSKAVASIANGVGTLNNDGSGNLSWGGGGETNPINNFYTTNNFFVSGKGNTLIVTQTLIVSGQYVYPIAPGTGITFTTNTLGAGQTNITIASTATGSTPTFTLLTQSGTNLASAIDFSGKASGSVWYIDLTNTLFVGTPSNLPTNPFTWYLHTRQPSTGTCFVTFTNGVFGFTGGSTNGPISDTNANHMDIWTFINSGFTNTQFMGVLTPDTRL